MCISQQNINEIQFRRYDYEGKKAKNFVNNEPGFEAETARLTKLTFSTLSTDTWASLSDPNNVIAFSLISWKTINYVDFESLI